MKQAVLSRSCWHGGIGRASLVVGHSRNGLVSSGMRYSCRISVGISLGHAHILRDRSCLCRGLHSRRQQEDSTKTATAAVVEEHSATVDCHQDDGYRESRLPIYGELSSVEVDPGRGLGAKQRLAQSTLGVFVL